MKMLLIFAIGLSLALTSMVANGILADPGIPKPPDAPTVFMDDVHIVKSPSNWSMTGTAGSMAMEAVFVGSYFRIKFNGTGIDIHVDTAGLSEYPWVGYRIDDGKDTISQLTADQKVIKIGGLAAADHSLFVYYHARNNYNQKDTWADAQKFRVMGLSISGGRGILPSAPRPLKGILYGDSITAGLACGAPPGVACADNHINGATSSYAYFLGNGLNAEYDQAGCGADGWTKGGVGGFPGFRDSWNYKKAKVTRDLSQHDFVTIYHGYNDAGSEAIVSAMMGSLRGANAKMWIFVMVPFSGRGKTAIVKGVADYISQHPTESKIKVIDTSGVRIKTSDGIHPTPEGAEILAKFMISAIREFLGPEATTRTATSRPAPAPRTTSGNLSTPRWSSAKSQPGNTGLFEYHGGKTRNARSETGVSEMKHILFRTSLSLFRSGRERISLSIAMIISACLTNYAGFTADVPTVGNPPGRPTGLLTEFQVEPLAIDQLKPRLAWQVQDPDRGERQTAYQILVASDRDILAADRGDRWDSGRVASTQSTAVLYGGQELKPDQRSWWKVRTWDKDGKASPYSEPARFDTGIGMTGEAAWTAKFIWDGTENKNNYAYFRKEFTIPAGRKLRSAKLFASAHNVYQLFLNGTELGYGPARSNPFLYGQYNVYDLTDQLGAGKHALAARCHWMGTWGDSGVNAAPAFIAELRLVFTDGTKLTVATDPTWKTLAATPFDEDNPVLFGKNGGVNNRSAERFDARKEPLGWLKSGFDDGSWASASEVKRAFNLFAQVTPRSRIQHVVDPVTITQDGELWKVDFGKNMYAVPRLTMIANEPGDVITCTYFDDGVCKISVSDGWDQYTCRGGGRETYEKWNGWGGIRSMSVKGYRGTLTADNVKALVRYSEGDKQGDFTSSDTQLNSIYGLCEWTSRMATQEGGFYDDDSTEQSSWACDSYTGGENLFYSIRNYRVQHKTLRDYIAEQAANGMIYACSPAQKYHLPDFSLNLYQSTWDYHLFTNDLTLIETTYPGLRKFLVDFIGTRRDPTTRLSTVKGKSWGGGYSTSDWNPDYIDASGKALTVHNMLYYNALRVMSRLASDLGRKADIAEFDAIAAEVKNGINTALFDGVEKYRDGLGVDKFHLLPAVWAIHNDLVPADKREAVLRYIRNYPGYGLELASIGQCVFFDTMYPLGTEGGKLMEFLHHPNRWLKMIPNYCTTEHVDGGGIPLAVLPNSPGTMLPRYVGGVRPTSPGFSTFDIKPTVDGLAWAKVQVPTVKGMVTVAWQKPVAATGPAGSGKDSGGSGLDLMATIPANTLAEVWLPKQGLNRVMVSEGNAVVWDGSRFKEGTPGVLSVNDTKLWVRLTVGSGSYKFKIGPAGDQGQR